MAAEGALLRLFPPGDDVEVVGKELFRPRRIDLPLPLALRFVRVDPLDDLERVRLLSWS